MGHTDPRLKQVLEEGARTVTECSSALFESVWREVNREFPELDFDIDNLAGNKALSKWGC